jgi:hypothetical protein
MAEEAPPAISETTVTDETAPLRSASDESAQLTGVAETTFNMINCFVGAGILTVPFAFRLAGYSACILVLFVAGLNWYTSLILGEALDKAASMHPDVPYRSWNMGSLARAAFGPRGEHCIRVIFGLELWFALETFLVLTGISVNLLTGLPEPAVIVVAGTIGSLSLSLPMKNVSFMSFIGVACMVGGLFALIICGMGRIFDHPPNVVPSAETHHTFMFGRTPASLGIFLYCFSGLPCLPNIRNAMRRPKEEYAQAVHNAFAYSSVYYLAVGMLGYEFFANDTRRSFLKDLAPLPGEGHSNIYGYVAAVAAGLFALKLQAGFPLYAGPVLEAAGLGANDGLSTMQTVIARSVFCVVSVVFAVFARHQLDAVAELMGAFLTNTTSIIFPVAAYLAVTTVHGSKLPKKTYLGLYALLLFGVSYGIIGTISAFSNIWFGTSIHVGQNVAVYVASNAVGVLPNATTGFF